LATTDFPWRFLHTFSSKLSLITVLVIAFVVQIVMAVAITGWFSFSNGQKAVNELAKQLRNEVIAQIEQHLKNYLTVPLLINQINLDVTQLGLLNLQDTEALSHYVSKQIQRFDTVSYIAIGTETARYVGAKRFTNNLMTLEISDESTGFALKSWRTDWQLGNRKLKATSPDYDPRKRPWYQAAVTAGQAIWSPIYVYFSGQTTGLSANQPIHNAQGQLVGVSTVDLTLLDIGRFLRELDISQQGQIFILERSGFLIATSTSEKPFHLNEEKRAEPFKAIDSHNPLTQAVAIHLARQSHDFTEVKAPYQTEFFFGQERHLLQINPFADTHGLNWLIVTVIPENYFMSQIKANNLVTAMLLFLFSAVATLVGIMTAHWIVKPLLNLKYASQRLTQGQWDCHLAVDRSDEIGDLAKTFQQMSQQLQSSFITLHDRENYLKQLNQSYERFIPREFLNLLGKQSVTEIELGDQIAQEMTILFSDIRGFTSLSERMTPQENFNFINGYLGIMEPVIGEYHGFIDKYIGDAIMALFSTHADDAVQGALAMLKALRHYNEQRQQLGEPLIQIGIGLNTGPLMLGVVGGKHRMEGTVIADAVNLASRVEGLTKIYGVSLLMTTQTYLKLEKVSRYHIRVIDSVMVKGKSEPVTIYEIFDADDSEIVILKDKTLFEFEQAFVLYHSGELEEAGKLFENVVKMNPQDRVAQIYLERCTHF